MLKVQRKMAIPEKQVPARPRTTYPFEQLEVGDMFFIPEKTRKSLAPYIYAVGVKLGVRFSVRTTQMLETRRGWKACDSDADGAVAGLGVWRVK